MSAPSPPPDSRSSLVVDLTDPGEPSLGEVGGKALSLVRLVRAGLTVPPAFVLTASFVAPWLRALEALPGWRDFTAADSDEALRRHGAALKAQATSALSFSDDQRRLLTEALAVHASPGRTFAVRSSSPEEDLEEASFAGAYETLLGVPVEGMEAAVLQAFVSCLDPRVLLYKRRRGFDPRRPRIALIVQRQVASEVSGVAFSLNPATEAPHEVVFNASWGLGEAVVSGQCSPDLYVVDKQRRQVLRREVGEKETALWLAPGGGTEERPDPRHEELVLSDDQVLALADGVMAIERAFGRPVDVEWALAEENTYWLQARPIARRGSGRP